MAATRTAQVKQSPREQYGISLDEFRQMGMIGAMYYEQGDLGKAEIIFAGLVELDPLNVDANSALGAVLVRTQRDAEALPYLNQALAIDERQIAALVNRAEVYIRQQRAAEAVADLKRAIDLDPEEKDPAANRARAMALGIHEALQQEAGRKVQTSNN
jgi:tetratricopeptide (TPR) repeat protein